MYDLNKLPTTARRLDAFERDCAITVALKIADESCKMNAYEKSIFMALYDCLQVKESQFFSQEVFKLIDLGRNTPTTEVYRSIKSVREAAMDMITRPKMKAFKASIREQISPL